MFLQIFVMKWVLVKSEQNHREPDTYINDDNTNVGIQSGQKTQKDEKTVF